MAANDVVACSNCLKHINLLNEKFLKCRGNRAKIFNFSCTKLSEDKLKAFIGKNNKKWCCKSCSVIIKKPNKL